MRFVTFQDGGAEKIGVRQGDTIIDVSAAAAAFGGDMIGVIKGGDAAKAALAKAAEGGAGKPMADVKLLPPIPNPGKILCIGRNYAAHAAEGGAAPPTYPEVFVRFPSSLVAHGEPLVVPNASDKFDFEGEMAVIIGKTCRHVPEADALSVIAGYSCYNDGSIRDYQRHTSQFVPGKSFYKSGGFGPWMVTADEIPDPATLTLMTRLNGEEMQRATTDDLLFSIPQLIHYLSTVSELVPGDVIVSGTTGGVGFYRDPQVFMKEGDTVEIELDKIGILRNPIINEK